MGVVFTRQSIVTLKLMLNKVQPNLNKRLILAEPKGLCAGVKRAIYSVEKALEMYGPPIYCLNEIVHNRQVVEKFSSEGVVFVDNLAAVPQGSLLLFSAHGVPPSAREEAKLKNLRVIDATCPFVDKAHQQARSYAAKGYSLILIGKHGHDEVVGIMGEAPESVQVVETLADAREVQVVFPGKVAVLTQTTLSREETEAIRAVLRKRFAKLKFPASSGICYATRNRQEAVKRIAREVQTVLVLGSENSSNSQRLVEIARAEGVKAELVPDLSQLLSLIPPGTNKLGLSAGASVPEYLIDQAIALLSKQGYLPEESDSLIRENVRFALPAELT